MNSLRETAALALAYGVRWTALVGAVPGRFPDPRERENLPKSHPKGAKESILGSIWESIWEWIWEPRGVQRRFQNEPENDKNPHTIKEEVKNMAGFAAVSRRLGKTLGIQKSTNRNLTRFATCLKASAVD